MRFASRANTAGKQGAPWDFTAFVLYKSIRTVLRHADRVDIYLPRSVGNLAGAIFSIHPQKRSRRSLGKAMGLESNDRPRVVM